MTGSATTAAAAIPAEISDPPPPVAEGAPAAVPPVAGLNGDGGGAAGTEIGAPGLEVEGGAVEGVGHGAVLSGEVHAEEEDNDERPPFSEEFEEVELQVCGDDFVV